MADMEVSPQEKMANPQGVERHGLPEDFLSFPARCGAQSSPLVSVPNRPIVWGLRFTVKDTRRVLVLQIYVLLS